MCIKTDFQATAFNRLPILQDWGTQVATPSIMEKKTRRIHFVVTQSVFENIKSKAAKAKFRTLTDYFLSASNEYSDVRGKEKIEISKSLAEFYKKFNADLSHIGSNFNQRLKHCNELAKIGQMNKQELDEQISLIEDLKNLLLDMQNELYDITRKVSKF